MTTAQQAHTQAAQSSRTDGPRYVAHTQAQGFIVITGEQARKGRESFEFEALYVDGVKVADAEMAQRIATVPVWKST